MCAEEFLVKVGRASGAQAPVAGVEDRRSAYVAGRPRTDVAHHEDDKEEYHELVGSVTYEGAEHVCMFVCIHASTET